MPRAGLTPARVVDEAAELSDQVGPDAVTLAALAQRLGVRVPSLYKHVDGLDAVRVGVATLALRELGARLAAAAVGRSRREALVAMATAYRQYAREHPGRYAATLRAADPSDAAYVAAAESVLATVSAVLAGYGLRGDDAVDATRALRAALHGYVTLEAAGGFAMDRDPAESFRRMVAGLDRAFGGSLAGSAP